MLNLVGLGGTFDHLHKGHKFLLETALKISKKIVIGLTSQELLRTKKYYEKIQSYSERKENLEKYLNEIVKKDRFNIVKLSDPYGPPINEAKYEGIVVSQETYEGALKINEIRNQKGFPPLIIIVIPLLKNKDNQRISSTLIRKNLKKEKKSLRTKVRF